MKMITFSFHATAVQWHPTEGETGKPFFIDLEHSELSFSLIGNTCPMARLEQALEENGLGGLELTNYGEYLGGIRIEDRYNVELNEMEQLRYFNKGEPTYLVYFVIQARTWELVEKDMYKIFPSIERGE